MAGSAVLIDTNMVIALFAGAQEVLAKIAVRHVYIPSIVLGELYYGAFNSALKERNVLKIDELGATAQILSVDKQTGRVYGEIKSFLKAQGTPIPENDIWIAALAKQYQIPVATRDRHFQHLATLIEIEAW